jgi:hypothetical protein
LFDVRGTFSTDSPASPKNQAVHPVDVDELVVERPQEQDGEARAIGMAAIEGYAAYREKLGLRSTLQGLMRAALAKGEAPGGYVFGAPDTVAAELAAFGRAGLGGLIIRFDIGPMAAAQSRRSLRRFMAEVAPALRKIVPDAAVAA